MVVGVQAGEAAQVDHAASLGPRQAHGVSRYPGKHAMPDVLAWDHYLKLGDVKGESA